MAPSTPLKCSLYAHSLAANRAAEGWPPRNPCRGYAVSSSAQAGLVPKPELLLEIHRWPNSKSGWSWDVPWPGGRKRPWSWVGSPEAGMRAAALSPRRRKVGGYAPCAVVGSCASLCTPPVSTSHNSDGMLLSLLALCRPFPCPPDHKPAPLVPVVWRCPSRGQEVELTSLDLLLASFRELHFRSWSVWILLLSSRALLKTFRAWSHHAFHKHVLDPSSKVWIKVLARPRLEASLWSLGVSHR